MLNHLTAPFKDRALFNHQRRRLNVAIQFRGAAQLDALAGDDVAVHNSMNRGHGNFDVRIDLAACAHNQRAGARTDFAREVPVNAKHGFE